MEMTKRVVVVGMGSIGRRHARLLATRQDLRVELCDTDERRLADSKKELGDPQVFRNFDDVLSSKPDIVVIATPHGFHADQSIRALQEGIHVLCEKPMSDDLEQAMRMMEVSQRARSVLNIGFHLHFHPGLIRLKQLIDEGQLGNIVHFHCRVGSYITLVNSSSRYQSGLVGALLLDYAHQPDLIYWILGKKPEGIYMVGGKGGELELSSNPNFLTLVCDFDSELMATIHLNYLQMPERHEYEIVGDEGWALWDLNTGILRIGRRADSSEHQERISVERDPVYAREHQAFLDAVEGKRLPESPAHKAIVSLRIIETALLSWNKRQRVIFSD
jgi:predicted dehydrogenase